MATRLREGRQGVLDKDGSESSSAEVTVKRSAAPDFLPMVNLIDNAGIHSVAA